MNRRSRRLAAAYLALILALFFTGALAFLPMGGPEVSVASLSPPELIVSPVQVLSPINNYDSIASRPLFAPTRCALPPLPATRAAATTALSSPPPVIDPLTLLAVVITPTRREAVVRGSDGQSLTLKIGDSYQAWILAAVQPDHVVFRDGKIEQAISFPP